MDKKKLAGLWAVVSMACIIAMLIAQGTFHWEQAWTIPMIGVVICLAVTFFFGREE
jgi:hypothetical protein